MSGVRPNDVREFRLLHREPPFGRERQGIEQRIERRMKMQRRTEVVGAAALAGVAAENPPVEGNFRGRRPFDRMTGDAAARIDRAVVANGTRRAGFDAAAARSRTPRRRAARRNDRRPRRAPARPAGRTIRTGA